MYYISQLDDRGSASRLTSSVRRLRDFTRFETTEGSQWVVRRRRYSAPFDAYPIYSIKDGKLRRTGDYAVMW